MSQARGNSWHLQLSSSSWRGIILALFVCLVNKIRETWYHVYRRHFLQQSLTTAGNCRKGFYYYQKGFEESGVSWFILPKLNTTAATMNLIYSPYSGTTGVSSTRFVRGISSVTHFYCYQPRYASLISSIYTNRCGLRNADFSHLYQLPSSMFIVPLGLFVGLTSFTS